MAIVKVDFKESRKSAYDIVIGSSLAPEIEKVIQHCAGTKRKVAFLVDEAVMQTELFSEKNGVFKVIKGGEKSKNLKIAEEIYNFLIENKIDRRGVLFIIGGGVLGDLGGFVAATYMRGIDYYQVPTTLLAMVDSAIGGKTAVNIAGGKNLVGAFYQPKGVFIDINFLKTLPEREFAAGMAELIKYALIVDETFFLEIEKEEVVKQDSLKMIDYITKACEIKKAIVQEDERDEKGVRRILNFGHTFGHAIESVAGYGTYLHGEAVSIGMVMAAKLSQKLGYLNQEEVRRIESVLEKYQLPVRLKFPLKIEELNRMMDHDKKVEYGVLTYIILKKIGVASEAIDVNREWIRTLWIEVGAKD